jgi:hypothetical protein
VSALFNVAICRRCHGAVEDVCDCACRFSAALPLPQVADGATVDDEWAPFERPDETATAEKVEAKVKSIKRDIPFALPRGTTGQVTTAFDVAQCAAED